MTTNTSVNLPVAGSGTVTSVSVTTANGVSGSVATATTTPAITLTLGAITPTTVVASGAISGASLAIADDGLISIGSQNSAFKSVMAAPGGMAADVTVTLPATQGSINQVLYSTDGLGALGWAPPGVSQNTLNGSIVVLNGKQVADLFGTSNVALTGVQTVDGVATSSAQIVCLGGQTDQTENGLWSVNDFGAWTRPANWADGIAPVPGALISITSGSGGVGYSNSLWLGSGDSSSTAAFYRVTYPTKQYATPATAATINVGANAHTVLFVNPAGTIATLTINLPSNPVDLNRVEIGSSQIVTSLTIGNGTVVGTLTTIAAGGFATFVYSSNTSSWFRMG